MKIAIFGASGFVGRNIVEALKEANMDIVALDIKDLGLEDVDQEYACHTLKELIGEMI